MKNLVVHTPNPKKGDGVFGLNERFNDWYQGEYDNTDRLTIVGIPNEGTKELSVGISFAASPDNFSRAIGKFTAIKRAATKPYVVYTLEDFTQENCLKLMYDLHDELIGFSVKEVKKLVNQQVVK